MRKYILGVVSIACLMGPFAAFAAGPAAINLGSAANFTILAKTGLSTTGSTSIIGNIGVSPAAAISAGLTSSPDGGGWIRTIVGIASGFTAHPL